MSRLDLSAVVTVLIGAAWVGCGGSTFSAGGSGGASSDSVGSSGTSAGSSGSTGAGGNTSAGGNGGSTGGGGMGGAGGKGGSDSAGAGGGKLDAGGTGGQPVDASRPDGALACAGSVTFHMSAANGRSSDYCVGSQCSNVWVTVTAMGGTPVTFSQGCTPWCGDCQPVACPPGLCFLPQPMNAQGETFTWDGTNWAQGTCGAQTVCRAHQCAVPGKYVARMCAARSTPDAGTFSACSQLATPICVDVPFDYPSPTTVEGVIN